MTAKQTSTSRYLWAAEERVTLIPTDRLVEDRYHAIAPNLWLDTKPQSPPELISPLPTQALVYAHLYKYKLHLPQLYGFCSIERAGETIEIPLLENIPIDSEGKLLPSLAQAWLTATDLNRVYWLWQAIELWAPLAGVGALSSLAVIDNLRVDGWCLRLCEPIDDRRMGDNKLTLAKLAQLWMEHLPQTDSAIDRRLHGLLDKMQAERVSLRDVAAELNQMTVERAARLPLEWQIAGGTDAGAAHQHNEDSYYPQPLELAHDPTGGKIAIVCDGIAGHEGGEVASQLAVKLLKIEAQTLFKELINSRDLVTPEQICKAIAAIVRVVNNTIVSQNQSQGREELRRMGTTMVMAIQVNQRIPRAKSGVGNSHEIYIAHVGDSRAYWITRDRCQLLTIDDDIATREVMQGRDLYWHSASRPDATALAQALGMKAGEMLQPTVQRLMAIEDGILLLCSDGLSDRDLVENSWQDYAAKILDDELPLAEAVQSWLALAHGRNGDDNITLVLMSVRVSPQTSTTLGGQLVTTTAAVDEDDDGEELEEESERVSIFSPTRAVSLFLIIVTAMGFLAAIAIVVAFLNPEWVEEWRQKLMPQPQSSRSSLICSDGKDLETEIRSM